MYSNVTKNGVSVSQLINFFTNQITDLRSVQDSVELLVELNYLITKDERLYIYEEKKVVNNFSETLISSIIEKLFFDNASLISKDKLLIVEDEVQLATVSFPMRYFALRNFLINEKVMINKDENLIFSKRYFDVIRELFRETNLKLSLDELKDKMLRQEEQGRKAELFVIDYESRRLLNRKAIQISDFDVTAGYDIKSYLTSTSTKYDKFIEVKCYSSRIGFYWSKNEIETAKRYGSQYFLYLVDSKLDKEPIIIENPYLNVFANKKIERVIQSFYFSLND